ncbi:MAG: polysaccharide deacetylase family protein [Kangiella sp.]|nr:polysaccharide deacetylase family protein [Kangiella sp.]
MKIFLTLDYELFFGHESGSAEACILRPTKHLLKVLDKVEAKATFFVDVGYISRADELDCDQDAVSKVKLQIQELEAAGHDIQLHIHPHWEKSHWRNGAWDFELDFYKLSDFSKAEAHSIVKKYTDKLNSITKSKAIAYRAGGWCIQPFNHFSDALYESGIRVDSTIYKDGLNLSKVQGFNFRNSPNLAYWKFGDDPLTPEDNGRFIELPISSSNVSPLFFWKFALVKKIGGIKHHSFGDGSAAPMSKFQLKRLLTQRSRTVASIDGYKSSLLNKFRNDCDKQFGSKANLVLIGHPKSLTPYSLKKLDTFLSNHSNDNYVTISQWYNSL